MSDFRSVARSGSAKSRQAFTLTELLASLAILIVIMAILLAMTEQTSSLWQSTSGKIESFRDARAAFDAVTRTISQATLNTYYDYTDSTGNWIANGSGAPASYGRRSDLHFICGQGSTLLAGSSNQTPITHCVFFQAPLGYSATSAYANDQRLINACGFYLVYGPDPNVPSFLPSLFNSRYRYRLMQFMQPSENLTVYQTSATSNPTSWFTQPIVGSYDTSSNFVLAENVIALLIWPKISAGDQAQGGSSGETTDYSYDTRKANAPSTNQLPPIVEVTMVSLDEPSALRLGNTAAAPNAAIGLTSGLFTFATYPTGGAQSQLEIDLGTMESKLTASHLTYRVFQTEVAIGSAKWTPPTSAMQ